MSHHGHEHQQTLQTWYTVEMHTWVPVDFSSFFYYCCCCNVAFPLLTVPKSKVIFLVALNWGGFCLFIFVPDCVTMRSTRARVCGFRFSSAWITIELTIIHLCLRLYKQFVVIIVDEAFALLLENFRRLIGHVCECTMSLCKCVSIHAFLIAIPWKPSIVESETIYQIVLMCSRWPKVILLSSNWMELLHLDVDVCDNQRGNIQLCVTRENRKPSREFISTNAKGVLRFYRIYSIHTLELIVKTKLAFANNGCYVGQTEQQRIDRSLSFKSYVFEEANEQQYNQKQIKNVS